jgi:tetrahydromethanopterin S-methyltransferase subunit D
MDYRASACGHHPSLAVQNWLPSSGRSRIAVDMLHEISQADYPSAGSRPNALRYLLYLSGIYGCWLLFGHLAGGCIAYYQLRSAGKRTNCLGQFTWRQRVSGATQ